jgi:hypothetical protein
VRALRVEVGDEVSGGGDHDRVQPSGPVENPCVKGILDGFGQVADVDASVIKVEIDRHGPTFAEGERCSGLGGVGEAVQRPRRVGEAVQLGQAEGGVAVLDVTEDTAGADRGELLIISDQSDIRTTTDGELHGRVEREGVGHAGFVDDHQGRWAGRCRPVGQLAIAE